MQTFFFCIVEFLPDFLENMFSKRWPKLVTNQHLSVPLPSRSAHAFMLIPHSDVITCNIVRQGESVQPCSRRDSIRPGDLAWPAGRTLHRAMTTTRRVAMRRSRPEWPRAIGSTVRYASNKTFAMISDARPTRRNVRPRSVGTIRREEKKIKIFS